MSIPFTQFLRPNGKRRHVSIDRPADVEAKAQALIDAGCRFEIEELTTGHVNIECCGPVLGEDGTISGELCHNGPEVLEAVDRIVNAACERLVEGPIK